MPKAKDQPDNSLCAACRRILHAETLQTNTLQAKNQVHHASFQLMLAAQSSGCRICGEMLLRFVEQYIASSDNGKLDELPNNLIYNWLVPKPWPFSVYDISGTVETNLLVVFRFCKDPAAPDAAHWVKSMLWYRLSRCTGELDKSPCQIILQREP